MADVQITVRNLDDVLRKLAQVDGNVKDTLAAAVTAAGAVFAADANGRAPSPVIETRITERRQTSVTAQVKPDRKHWYYRFVETGAQAHEITPSSAALLQFDVNGRTIKAARVRHPGMPARPFLRPAYDTQRQAAEGAAGAKIRSAVDRVR
jgi:HK97 gp10 family phage protein